MFKPLVAEQKVPPGGVTETLAAGNTVIEPVDEVFDDDDPAHVVTQL